MAGIDRSIQKRTKQPKQAVGDSASQDNFEELFTRVGTIEEDRRYFTVGGHVDAGTFVSEAYLVGSSSVGVQVPYNCRMTEALITTMRGAASAKTITITNREDSEARTVSVDGSDDFTPSDALDFALEDEVSVSVNSQDTNTGFSVVLMFREAFTED